MAHFIPGKIIKEFKTKSGKSAVLRNPKWEDLDEMTEYTNALSKEDTFISFSGEDLSLKEEVEYLASTFSLAELGDLVKVFCEIEGKLAGVCDIRRELSRKRRSRHIGILSLTVAKEFRNDGIGKVLLEQTIEEANRQVSDLKMIWLHVFGTNDLAKNLYQKLGFVEVAKIPGELLYKGEYIEGLQMVLKL